MAMLMLDVYKRQALYVAKKSGRNRVEILAYHAEPAPAAAPAETAVAT